MNLITDVKDERLETQGTLSNIEWIGLLHTSLCAALKERDDFRDGMARLGADRIAILSETGKLRHQLKVADDVQAAYQREEKRILSARDAALKERDQLKEEKARVHGLVNDACMKGLQVVRERDAALSRAEEWERDSLQHLNDYKCAMIDIDGLKREIYFLKESHCKDCCCQKSWDALGITGPTDKSIPEHIDALRAIVARIEVEEMAEAIHDAFDGGKFDQDSQQDIELFTARALVAHLLGKEG